MRSEETIRKMIDEYTGELKKCRYCGGTPAQHTREDINVIGIKGFVSTIRCPNCLVSVSAFGGYPKSAEIQAKSYWQRGILDS